MLLLNYETLVDPFLRDVRRITPEFSGMKAGDRVLDVCCGTGAQVLEYGRRDVIATGIDISPGMLNIAARNMMKQKAVNVSFQLADATNLPFPDRSFDYASISLGLHDKEKLTRDRILCELKRVVKQYGALIFIDFQVPMPNNVWAAFARTIEFLVGRSNYRAFKDYLRSGGLRQLLRSHGLREDSTVYLKSGLIVITKALNNEATISRSSH